MPYLMHCQLMAGQPCGGGPTSARLMCCSRYDSVDSPSASTALETMQLGLEPASREMASRPFTALHSLADPVATRRPEPL